MNELINLSENIVSFLSEKENLSDIDFVTEFPNTKKAVPLKRVTVAVGIHSLEITDSFAEDENGVLQRQEYCRSAQIRLRFTVHTPYSMGGGACHRTFARVTDTLIFDSGLDITKTESEKITEDRDTDALVLTGYASLSSSLCPADECEGDFPAFFDKTLFCSSHITNTDIHLSSSEKQFLDEPFITGTYYGTGEGEMTKALLFTPSCVIITANNYPVISVNNGVEETYFAFCMTGAHSLGAQIVTNGFKVYNGSAYASQGVTPKLNESGVTYKYMVFR